MKTESRKLKPNTVFNNLGDGVRMLRMADVIEGRQALGRPRREHESEKEVIR